MIRAAPPGRSRERAGAPLAAWACVGLLFGVAACGPPVTQVGEAGTGPSAADPNDVPAPVDANAPPARGAVDAAGSEEDQVTVALYFVNAEGDLVRESRRVEPAVTPALMARRLIEALAQGPREGLQPTLPPDTAVRAAHLGPDGTAYVDLDSAFSRGLMSGSRDALTAVRSLTETLAANIPECARVKILVEGDEVRDLGGHLDLSRPVVPESGSGGSDG